MKFKGILIGAASGSVGGDVYSHNRGGQYIRNRTFPVQPNTTPQLIVRALVGLISSSWVGFTQARRDGWDTYAANVLLPNKLGRPVNVGGKNMLIRSHLTRTRLSIPGGTLDAPTVFDQDGPGVVGQVGVSSGLLLVTLTFDTTDAWVSEDGAFLMLYASIGRSPGRNYYKGPYLLAGPVLGNSVTPPTSPQLIGLQAPIVPGDKVFFRAKTTRADGRVSPDQRFFGIAT